MPTKEELAGTKRDYDPDFDGPLANRQCTDILFLILFFAFWIGMFVVAGFAVDQGDIGRLLYPRDSFGNICGINNKDYNDTLENLEDNQFLYLPDPTDTSVQICVEECPGRAVSVSIPVCGSLARLPSSLGGCNDDDLVAVPTSYDVDVDDVTDLNVCCAYESSSFFYRCIPSDESALNATLDALQLNLDGADTEQVVGDLANTWHWILLCGCIALLLGFAWLWVVKVFGALIVWATIFTSIACLAALGGLAYWYAGESEDNVEDEGFVIDTVQDNADAVRVLAYITWAVTFVLILIVIFMRKRINLALGIMAEAGDAISAMPTIIFYPLITFASLVVLMVYWMYIALYLASAWKDKDDVNFGGDASDEELQWAAVYHFFGLLWTLEFILAAGQVVLAGAIATYYFTRDKRNLPSSPILGSFLRTIKFHLGTIAFGSLVLAIVQMIRAINAYLQEQAKRQGQSKIVQFCFSCISCCLKCVEVIVRFLNKNAYIMTAIYGYSFCKASKESFQLLFRNMARVLAVSMVGDFLMFLGKLFIVAICGLIGVAIFTGIDEDLYSWAIPALLVVILSYAIASGFMSVYDMAISTILLCFCEDVERHGTTKGQEPFMSERLRQIIDDNTDHDQINKQRMEDNRE